MHAQTSTDLRGFFISSIVATELISKIKILSDHPRMGRPVGALNTGNLSSALNASYIVRYRFDGRRLVVMRVLHGREQR